MHAHTHTYTRSLARTLYLLSNLLMNGNSVHIRCYFVKQILYQRNRIVKCEVRRQKICFWNSEIGKSRDRAEDWEGEYIDASLMKTRLILFILAYLFNVIELGAVTLSIFSSEHIYRMLHSLSLRYPLLPPCVAHHSWHIDVFKWDVSILHFAWQDKMSIQRCIHSLDALVFPLTTHPFCVSADRFPLNSCRIHHISYLVGRLFSSLFENPFFVVLWWNIWKSIHFYAN